MQSASEQIDLSVRNVTGPRNLTEVPLNLAGATTPFQAHAPAESRGAAIVAAVRERMLGGGWPLGGDGRGCFAENEKAFLVALYGAGNSEDSTDNRARRLSTKARCDLERTNQAGQLLANLRHQSNYERTAGSEYWAGRLECRLLGLVAAAGVDQISPFPRNGATVRI